MDDIVQDLIEYAVEYYCEGGMYQTFFNPTLTREEVEMVVKTINATSKIEFCDSIDRECVRDYLFAKRGAKSRIFVAIEKNGLDKIIIDQAATNP